MVAIRSVGTGLLLVASCFAVRDDADRRQESSAPSAAPSVQPVSNAWSEPARDVLAQACGSCHRSSLPTAKPGALAVFDLDQSLWYVRMTDAQVEELARRIGGTESLEEGDREIVAAFAACEVEGRCATERAIEP